MAAVISLITSWLCSESGVKHSITGFGADDVVLSPYIVLDGETTFGARIVRVKLVVEQQSTGLWGAAIGVVHSRPDGFGRSGRTFSKMEGAVETWQQAILAAFESLDPNAARFIDLFSLVEAIRHEIDFVVVSNPDLTYQVD